MPSSSEAKKRVCLRCDREFHSTGPGNRLCPRCLRDTENVRNVRGYGKNNGLTNYKRVRDI